MHHRRRWLADMLLGGNLPTFTSARWTGGLSELNNLWVHPADTPKLRALACDDNGI
jgi:hypothetical protein